MWRHYTIIMKKLLFKLMEYFPFIEVFAQCVYAQMDENKRGRIKKYVKETHMSAGEKVSTVELMEGIRSLGINAGDLVMIHSSMGGLGNYAGSPVELINALLDLVGEEGTVAMAAFPHYKGKDKTEIEGEEYTIYDTKRTGVSTGLLPLVFCKMQGVLRSKIPVNSIAVRGKCAVDMLKDEEKSDLVHGEYSGWNYLVEHHAKILYIGLEVIDADTIVHVVEDLMDNVWPVDNWYIRQKYLVRAEGEEKKIDLRVRDGFWHRFFVAHYSGRLMRKNHFVKKDNIKGIKLELVEDAGLYIDFLLQQAQRGRLLYRIPRRYWKKE